MSHLGYVGIVLKFYMKDQKMKDRFKEEDVAVTISLSIHSSLHFVVPTFQLSS